MKTIEELLINHDKENHNALLLHTMQLYKKLDSIFYTTECNSLFESYDLKEQYKRDYKVTLGEMYYNLGLVGMKLEKYRK